MRISDWSSDVCSSDLRSQTCWPTAKWLAFRTAPPSCQKRQSIALLRFRAPYSRHRAEPITSRLRPGTCARNGFRDPPRDAARSEEHTSELQSLMRISYAVFCLKKKKINYTKKPNVH